MINLKIISKAKSHPAIKLIRKKKWKNYANKFLLSTNELKELEQNEKNKKEILQNHIKKIPDEAEKIKKEIRLALDTLGIQDNYNKIAQDILLWNFAYGFSVNEYLCYDFMNKSEKERHMYISDREIVNFGYEVNDLDKMNLFSDKILTYKMYKRYFGREVICINDAKDYPVFQKFIKTHPQFVKKEARESCGRSVELVDITKEVGSEFDLFKFFISKGKTILEEPITQNYKMSIFNKSSVNTIRCITLAGRKGINVAYCFAKIGREGEFVDNGAAGGILVGIDVNSGIFATDGIDELGRRYEVHPDSGIKLKGFCLPEWEEMKIMCSKLAAKIPEVKFIGWDMAYSENGWVVVEGNGLSEAIGMQSTFAKGIRSDIEKYLTTYNISENQVFRYM